MAGTEWRALHFFRVFDSSGGNFAAFRSALTSRTKKHCSIEKGARSGNQALTTITGFEKLLCLDRDRFENEPLGAGNQFELLLNSIADVVKQQRLGAIGSKTAAHRIARQVVSVGITDTDLNVLDFSQWPRPFRGVLMAQFSSQATVRDNLEPEQ